jgi:hypothetical protein
MECRVVMSSLSEIVDGSNLLIQEEHHLIEEHLATCAKCNGLKLELTEIKSAARELPMHTPPRALWIRIANTIEMETPTSERRTREEFPELSWWDRLKARKLSLSIPQLAGAGALAAAVLMFGVFSLRNEPQPTLDVIGAQTALLPDESELRAKIERQLKSIAERKASWDAERRADFEQHLSKIEESMKICRQKLKADPNDPIQQSALRALYNEEQQYLEDVERLKW